MYASFRRRRLLQLSAEPALDDGHDHDHEEEEEDSFPVGSGTRLSDPLGGRQR